MNCGPVLSSNRYLPVINVIARKMNIKNSVKFYLDKGYSITKEQMLISLRRKVILANIKLVIKNFEKYIFIFIKKFLYTRFKKIKMG
jgi:hypothetical protein